MTNLPPDLEALIERATKPLAWQDIRLCAGEGKLSNESILSAANIIWGRRFDELSAALHRQAAPVPEGGET